MSGNLGTKVALGLPPPPVGQTGCPVVGGVQAAWRYRLQRCLGVSRRAKQQREISDDARWQAQITLEGHQG